MKRQCGRTTDFFVVERWLVLLPLLGACAAPDVSRRPPELIVEGNEQSYDAFEKAAQGCGYTAFQRWQGSVSVPPHYNLYRVQSAPARCATNWVVGHPETGLVVSAH